jgi:hypothetical protein
MCFLIVTPKYLSKSELEERVCSQGFVSLSADWMSPPVPLCLSLPRRSLTSLSLRRDWERIPWMSSYSVDPLECSSLSLYPKGWDAKKTQRKCSLLTTDRSKSFRKKFIKVSFLNFNFEFESRNYDNRSKKILRSFRDVIKILKLGTRNFVMQRGLVPRV